MPPSLIPDHAETPQKYTLNIESNVIKDAKFQAVGCAGAFSSGSALMEMVKGNTLEEAEKLTEENIINFLGGIPKQKIHCACLAKRTLPKAIKKYRAKA